MRTRVLAIIAGIFLVIGIVQLLPGAKAVTSLKPGSNAISGDFNGDGIDDLAVGVPDENVTDPDNDNSVANAGAVHVIYGDDGGLDTTADQFIYQEAELPSGGETVGESLEANDKFGTALAAGDFDNDGIDDLAIGVPLENVGSIADAGLVHVIYGSDDGLDAEGTGDNEVADQMFHQNSTGVPGVNEAGDGWGSSLISGDFDDDGTDDLAIGAPLEAIGKREDAGAVTVLYGVDGDGLKSTGAQLWHQDTKAIGGVSETNDRFGQTMAVANFDDDDDGTDDLAIGAPLEDVGKINSAGAVNVIYGSSSGLTSAGNDLWFQDVAGVRGNSEANDRFGEALGGGDLDGDGAADLVIGVPGELCGDTCSGVVQILLGDDGGLTADGDLILTQDKTKDGIDDAEDDDQFGAVINVNDFDGDDLSDIAVGIPLEDVDDLEDAGAVEILFGTDDGNVVDIFSEFAVQDDIATSAGGDEDYRFGAALASGNFDGEDDGADLAVGVPNANVDDVEEAGVVVTMYEAESGNTDNQEISQDDLTDDEDGAEEDDHFGIALG